MNGCPLDEKISEMNYLKSRANIIGSLAVAIIDNPMLAATGHRICNDCMKACIYQKQQPVNIPQVETRVLKDVLNLPWGFEIYSLLTRWNPLSFDNFYPKEDTGAKILVAGMGPAGFTLSHYLMNQGHIVVGIDGLKIEPISQKLLEQPIKSVNELFENLDERLIAGFGGVMEYGITNRWNKNFLLLIRLLLERRSNFKLFSGIRLGSNITPKQADEFAISITIYHVDRTTTEIIPTDSASQLSVIVAYTGNHYLSVEEIVSRNIYYDDGSILEDMNVAFIASGSINQDSSSETIEFPVSPEPNGLELINNTNHSLIYNNDAVAENLEISLELSGLISDKNSDQL